MPTISGTPTPNFATFLGPFTNICSVEKPLVQLDTGAGTHRQVSLSSASLQTHNAGCALQESCDCASAHRTHSAP